MSEKHIYYLIEGGLALDLIKAHCLEVLATDQARMALIKEISEEEPVVGAFRHRDFGTLIGVTFERGRHHPDFTKPRGRNKTCHPKKGTKWEQRFKDQPRVETLPSKLVDAYDIPLSMSFVKIEDGKTSAEGWSHIGWPPLNEVGFLYLSKDGPYAMWAPDVEAYVKAKEEQGYTVTGKCAVYKNNSLEGCRLVKKEEWELLVAQHNLDKANARN